MKSCHRHFRIAAVLFLVLGATQSSSAAEPPSITDNPFALNLKVDATAAAAFDFSPLRQRLQAAIDKGEVPCASMLIIEGDKVVFKEAFGWADIEHKKPMSVETICHLASSTKWVTAAVIMTVVDEGKMSLDDAVGKFFPGLKEIPVAGSDQKANPTIRQCYSQTSGIPQLVDRQYILKPGINLADGALAFSKDKPALNYAPGAFYQYGNASMSVAAACAEQATGKPFRQLLQERILDPLGMKETTFSPVDEQKARISNRYQKQAAGGWQLFAGPPPGKIETTMVAGGLFSTLDDYAKFLSMIAHRGQFGSKRILTAKSVEEFCKDQTGGAPIRSSPYRNQLGYSLGAAVMQVDDQGHATHVGDGGAFGTYCWIDLKRNVQGVFFSQTRLRDSYQLTMNDEVQLTCAAIDAGRGPSAATKTGDAK